MHARVVIDFEGKLSNLAHTDSSSRKYNYVYAAEEKFGIPYDERREREMYL